MTRNSSPVSRTWSDVICYNLTKQKLSSKVLAGEQKGCRCFFFSQHFVFKCNCLFAVFLSRHNLFFDLGSQTVCYCFTALKIASRNETKELSQAVSIKAANICGHCKWKNSGLSSGPSLGVLAAPGCSLAWALFLKSECRLNVRFFTACYLRKETPTSQADVFPSRS